MDFKQLKDGIINGYLDKNNPSNEIYRPSMLVNDIPSCEKVLSHIVYNLKECDEFFFVVAFATNSGIIPLIDTFRELEQRGVKGTIVLSQYQYFTEPRALEKIKQFKNIDLRMVDVDTAVLHSKGYIFRKCDEYTAIIGSSNLTQNALCVNKEWNIKINFYKEGSMLNSILNDFNAILELSTKVDETYIEHYKEVFKEVERSRKNYKIVSTKMDEANKITPNNMQKKALESLENLRNEGKDKALVCSATATGKTILLALDVNRYKPKKFLFLVHREQICKKAMESFKRVIEDNVTMAVSSAGNYVKDAQYVFATVQTMSKDKVLNKYDREEFDYIAIDEVHRAGAGSYKKIIDYFKPKFLLGMSATPDRTDGFNIYSLFDYNIAYDIRLQEAMEENLICPFHYFAISDLTVNGVEIDDNTEFRYLVSDERVKHIINFAKLYGYSGNRVKGLIFVSRKEEAKELSNKFNELGYRTTYLTGENSQEERDLAVNKLEADEGEILDYIFTVDIFNEGIDIPAVNQVIMLRPTQSSIIFIQQVGRGLRKYNDKEYVVVLDFIGNYDNNFLIPMAMSGKKDYKKEGLRRFVTNGHAVIPGASTINFDKISRERIFASIDRANFNDSKIFKEEYNRLKNKIGKIPSLMDFELFDGLDVNRFIDKYDSYYNFLLKNEKEYIERFNDDEVCYINYLSKEFISGKRPHELEFIRLAISEKHNLIEKFKKLMANKYPKLIVNDNTINCIVNQLTQEYMTGANKDKYAKAIIIDKINEDVIINTKFDSLLNNERFNKYINDIIDLGLYRYSCHYNDNYKDTNFKLYEKYTYKEIFKLLDWHHNEIEQNVGGYKYNKETNTYPIFINYKKDEEISDTTRYEDRFESTSSLIAISKVKRNIHSNDIQTIINADKNNTDIFLFIRKDKNDKNTAREFYFLGKVHHNGFLKEFTMKNTNATAVEIGYNLDQEVRNDIYEYIID